MNTKTLMMIFVTGLALGGCNKADSPADAQQQIAEARAQGNRDVADARADAQKDSIDAETDVAKAVADHNVGDAIDQAQEAHDVAARGNARIQLAQAEANHKVAIEKCQVLAGDAQKQCKDRADADLDVAKDQEKMSRDAAR